MAVDPSAETEAERPGAPASGSAPLATGATLGKYRLEHVLGAGGMGVVWAAVDLDLERAVAIKVLRVSDGSQTQRTRLLREARAMARLKHPNVLTVYEVGTANGVDYIAMELVEGENLGTWLSRAQPREDVIAALVAAGHGLAAAHEAGIVHRDFKPENVLRDRKGHVFVTDFGLAFGHVEQTGELVAVPVAALAAVAAVAVTAAGSGRRSLDSVLDSPLTQTGVLIGTPAYMAPEQFAGRPAGPRSDQFAYCVTAWEALTGARPFHGKDLAELKAAAAAGSAPAAPMLAPAVREVLARGLAADPDARWPDMPALLHALERALRPASAGRDRRLPRRAIWISIAAAAIVGGGVVLAVFGSGHSSGRAGDTCEPAEQVFANAWGPAKRAAVSKAHPGLASIAAFAILDETRANWRRAYQAACAEPTSPERHERLACLLEVRDEVATTTDELATTDSDLGVGAVVSLVTGVEACGQH